MNLQKWAERRGLNQKQLAEFLGVSEQFVSDYFLGKRGVSVKRALEISKKTKIGIIDLICPQGLENLDQMKEG